jgi:hypothetical protein
MEPVFCPDCVADSSEQTPGNISTTNGIGRMFYGNAEPCSKCGSTVRTLWLTFAHFPLIPLHSYHYKPQTEGARRSLFWARETRIRWNQVFKTWVIGICATVAAITAIVVYNKHKTR